MNKTNLKWLDGHVTRISTATPIFLFRLCKLSKNTEPVQCLCGSMYSTDGHYIPFSKSRANETQHLPQSIPQDPGPIRHRRHGLGEYRAVDHAAGRECARYEGEQGRAGGIGAAACGAGFAGWGRGEGYEDTLSFVLGMERQTCGFHVLCYLVETDIWVSAEASTDVVDALRCPGHCDCVVMYDRPFLVGTRGRE